VANGMALVKNYMPKFDTEILHKDFMIDDAKREALVDSVYDTAHHLESLYDFSTVTESDDNNSPETL
jgi:hypothetical protein